MYVGQTGPTVGFKRRRFNHLDDLRSGDHHSSYFQRAWNKYGEDAFEFRVLEDMSGGDPGALTEREQWWMDNTDSVFNMCPAAGSSLGIKRSPETRARIGAASLGRVQSPEARSKNAEANRGNRSNTGRNLTEVHKANIGAAIRGVPKSPEHRSAISSALTGKVRSSDHCANIAAGHARRRAELRSAAKARHPASNTQST